jgi:hypothetical protein
MGEGSVWDLGAQRIFSALRLKILMPGAKNRRQARATGDMGDKKTGDMGDIR